MAAARSNIDDLVKSILKNDRIALAKGITLVESTLPKDEALAKNLIAQLSRRSGNSIRLGITGSPGVGKSTFIEALGKHIVQSNQKLAILAIDPSSPITKGSILGDKTRMDELSKHPNVFVRPSPSREVLGGVATKTREVILLCEAAGFDVIIIETVGVGQSEVAVKNLVDFFLLLMLARSGDELQGIKKGIVEMADAIVITKADGDNVQHASRARAEFQQALHINAHEGIDRKVLTCSAITNEGIDTVWNTITSHIEKAKAAGRFQSNRQTQKISWLNESFDHLLKMDIASRKEFQKEKETLAQKMQSGELTAQAAADKLLSFYHNLLR